jgi:hypothetical protein
LNQLLLINTLRNHFGVLTTALEKRLEGQIDETCSLTCLMVFFLGG